MANRCSVYPYVVLLITVFFTANGEYITVIPTDGSQSCPLQMPYCQTFSQFMNTSNDSAVFNTSNSVVLFLPGEHKLRNHWSKLLIVRDVSNVTWQGEPTGMTAPTIHCEEDIGFLFADVVNLTIRNLDFFNCGHELPQQLSFSIFSQTGGGNLLLPMTPSNCIPSVCVFRSYIETWATIAIANVDTVNLQYVTIKHSKGYGLFAINMLGKSTIDSCAFQDSNRRNIAVGEKMSNHIVGGNAIITFFDVYNRSTVVSNSLTIKNSTFQNGSDNSLWNLDKCHFIPTFSSISINIHTREVVQKSRANGLAVITGQRLYQVQFSLEQSTFTGNIGKYGHPSVLISDLSGFENSFIIRRCNFTYGGKVRISTISNSYLPLLQPLHTETTNWMKMPVILKECNFSDTGVDICIYHDSKRFHNRTIAILDSTFEKHKPTMNKQSVESDSVVLMRYYYGSEYCPDIVTEIKNCTFHNNEIPSATFLFDPVINYQACKQNTTITEFFQGCQHENEIIHQQVIANEVVISGTLFTNNTSKFSGTVNTQNVFLALTNCTFQKSTGTAVRANNSMITLEGVNEFSENIGKEGGAFSLIESRIHFMPNSTTMLLRNRADYGGGIFAIPAIKNIYGVHKPVNYSALCTFSLPAYNTTLLKTINITIKLENNIANLAGNSIFNGAYDIRLLWA